MYTYLFYKHIMFRPACGICPYARINRPSDITVGDFLGWENQESLPPSVKDDKGLSLVLINTHKGRLVFERVSSVLEAYEIDLKVSLQTNLKHPSEFHPQTDEFW